MCSIKGAIATTSGSLVCNVFVQEDRLITPSRREMMLHPPVLLDVENAVSIFNATTGPQTGHLLRSMLKALVDGGLKSVIILDNADCGGPNLKHYRYLVSYVNQLAPDKLCLIRFVRCDAHMFHITASVAMSRSGSAGALYSSALLLRAGSHKWHMVRAVATVVHDELLWLQGGEPLEEDVEYTRHVLKHTLLRHVSTENQPPPGSAASRAINKLHTFAAEILNVLNTSWRTQRVGHRCRRLPDGRYCCQTRSN